MDAGLRQGHGGPDRRLLRVRRREPLFRVPGVRRRAGADQGLDRRARRHHRRRLGLHQPRLVRRSAVAVRLVCQPAGDSGRQPLRGRERGFRFRCHLVQRRPHRRRGLYHRGADPLQESPLRRCEPRAHGAHLRAPHHAAVRAGHLSAARPEGRPELPHAEHPDRVRRHPALQARRDPARRDLRLPDAARGGVARAHVERSGIRPDGQVRRHRATGVRRRREPGLQPGGGRRRPDRHQPPLCALLPRKAAVFPRGARQLQLRRRQLQPDAVGGAHADDREPDCRRQTHGQAGRLGDPRLHLRRRRAARLGRRGRQPGLRAGCRAALQARAEGRLVRGRLLHRAGGRRRVQPRLRRRRIRFG